MPIAVTLPNANFIQEDDRITFTYNGKPRTGRVDRLSKGVPQPYAAYLVLDQGSGVMFGQPQFKSFTLSKMSDIELQSSGLCTQSL